MQWLLCVVSVIGFVFAQDDAEQQTPVCGLPSARFQSREDNVPFCVVLTGNVTNANNTLEEAATHYTWFYPTVDEFTLFEIDTSVLLFRNESFIHIEVGREGGAYVSEQVQYSSDDQVVVDFHGYFNLVGGVVTEWVWDPNARELCDENTPVLDRFCSETRPNCYSEDPTFDCDVQVYVGWSGTDKNDVFLQSRESLLSNYRLFSTADLYAEASASARGQLESITIPALPDFREIIDNVREGLPDLP